MWDLLTTFMGRARSTITLELCCFRAVTALIQNLHQIFCSRSHIIFSRKCPTSVRMWDLLTTFMGRARSTITLQLCCFRAVTTITRNPHQIFCSRSPVKLSRQCPTSVCRWEVVTTQQHNLGVVRRSHIICTLVGDFRPTAKYLILS